MQLVVLTQKNRYKFYGAVLPIMMMAMAHAHAETSNVSLPAVSSAQTEEADDKDRWIDDKRKSTKRWLNRTAGKLDNWFGETDPNQPASANLRIMVDYYHNKYDGSTVKPRIRGKLKLPTLERHLSVLIGDDELDNQNSNIGTHAEGVDLTGRTFDRERSRDDNASLALRLSNWREKFDSYLDADIGMRSANEFYARLRAEKQWHHGKDTTTKLEQIYRYGTKSEHYLRTNYIVNKPITHNRSLTNHLYLDYTHKDDENFNIGNNFYQTHAYITPLGQRTLSYGVHVNSKFDEAKKINNYGPFVNYRQPIWRKWLFIQSELSYYNDKLKDRSHYLTSFARLEMIF